MIDYALVLDIHDDFFQYINACTLIKVVLIYFTYDLDAHDLDCAKSYLFID